MEVKGPSLQLSLDNLLRVKTLSPEKKVEFVDRMLERLQIGEIRSSCCLAVLPDGHCSLTHQNCPSIKFQGSEPHWLAVAQNDCPSYKVGDPLTQKLVVTLEFQVEQSSLSTPEVDDSSSLSHREETDTSEVPDKLEPQESLIPTEPSEKIVLGEKEVQGVVGEVVEVAGKKERIRKFKAKHGQSHVTIGGKKMKVLSGDEAQKNQGEVVAKMPRVHKCEEREIPGVANLSAIKRFRVE